MGWTLVINCLCFLILVILWALLTPMSWVWFHHSPVLTVPGAFRSVFHWRRQQDTSCNPLFIYTVTPLPKTKKLSRQQNQRKQYRCCSQPSSSETIQDTRSVNQTKPKAKFARNEDETACKTARPGNAPQSNTHHARPFPEVHEHCTIKSTLFKIILEISMWRKKKNALLFFF